MRSSAPLTWLGTLLVVAGIVGACVMSARASATVGECAEAAAATQTRAPTLAITRTADGAFEISHAALQSALATPGALTDSLRFEPVLKKSRTRARVVGYRAAHVARGSALDGVLARGDVLERVNGVALADTQKSLGLFGQLAPGARFTIEGTRAGAPLTVAVRITE